MAEHSVTPWYVVPMPWSDTGCNINAGSQDPHRGEHICSTDEGRWHNWSEEGMRQWAANARYIVAAVNECSTVRLSTEALEAGAVAGLVEAARKAVKDLALSRRSDWGLDSTEIMGRLNTALAVLDGDYIVGDSPAKVYADVSALKERIAELENEAGEVARLVASAHEAFNILDTNPTSDDTIADAMGMLSHALIALEPDKEVA